MSKWGCTTVPFSQFRLSDLQRWPRRAETGRGIVTSAGRLWPSPEACLKHLRDEWGIVPSVFRVVDNERQVVEEWRTRQGMTVDKKPMRQ